jgi:hypothetical protein
MSYRVWDKINSDEEHAEEVEANSPEEAAERYAEDDVDGNIDGIYVNGHVLRVRDPEGVLHEIAVTVEFDPVYYTRKVGE